MLTSEHTFEREATTVSARHRATRARRYLLGEFLRDASTLKSVRRCGFRLTGSEVALKLEGGVAHYSGVQRCGSVSSCPTCSARIRERRGEEIGRAGVAHLQDGGALLFVTLTMRHHQGQALADTWDAISGGVRRLFQGRDGEELVNACGTFDGDKMRLGRITAREATYGSNGWHPHVHSVWFVRGSWSESDTAWLRSKLDQRWGDWMSSQGFERPKTGGVGVDVQPVVLADHDPATVTDKLGKYLCKASDVAGGKIRTWGIGREMTRVDLKKGKGVTPFALLELAVDQVPCEQDALALWREWERATFGRQVITWSTGLKARLGITEITDEDIVDETIGGTIVAMIGRDQWRTIARRRGLRSRLLEAAERNGREAVDELLMRVGLVDVAVALWSPPPDVEP